MMDRDELIMAVEKIPTDYNGISENLKLMLKHAKFLEEISDINDPLAKGLLDVAPAYIRRQLEWLRAHLDDQPDLIAWISRNLMELFFMLRYMYSSRDRYDEVIKEQLKDLKEIEEVLLPAGILTSDTPEHVKAFHLDMKHLWEAMGRYGVQRDELKRPNTVKHYAEGAALMHEYDGSWRIHSKYVHPTSYLLFGKRSFVYGTEARVFFWAMAQYFAAWNLRDLHGMLLAARAHP